MHLQRRSLGSASQYLDEMTGITEHKVDVNRYFVRADARERLVVAKATLFDDPSDVRLGSDRFCRNLALPRPLNVPRRPRPQAPLQAKLSSALSGSSFSLSSLPASSVLFLESLPTSRATEYLTSLFSYVGLLGWNLFANTVTKTSTCLVGNSQLISKVFFPPARSPP